MKKILVSACLLGIRCKYSGDSNKNQKVLDYIGSLKGKAEVIPICPEVMGGLSTPRIPAEIQGQQVITADGRDVTKEYQKGAMEALKLSDGGVCLFAILKERSPSCGSGEIYDGTFTHTLISGDGITARLLKQNGIKVIGESADLPDTF